MNLVFFGDDHYSGVVLNALVEHSKTSSKHALMAVVTTRPKPKGREQIIEPGPIEILADKHNLKVLYYESKGEELINIIELLKSGSIELGVLASFGHILPSSLLSAIPQGIINVHPSLLPQYRGATPVQHALALGDSVTGVTLFRLTPAVDDGEIIAQIEEPILPTDTTPTLSTRMFAIGSRLLTDWLSGTPDSKKSEFPASPAGGSGPLIYTRTFTRDSGFLEWDVFVSLISGETPRGPSPRSTNELLNLRQKKDIQYSIPYTPYAILSDLVRALSPWPGVWTLVPLSTGVKRLKLLSPAPDFLVHLEGKPSPQPWLTFQKIYLQQQIQGVTQ